MSTAATWQRWRPCRASKRTAPTRRRNAVVGHAPVAQIARFPRAAGHSQRVHQQSRCGTRARAPRGGSGQAAHQVRDEDALQKERHHCDRGSRCSDPDHEALDQGPRCADETHQLQQSERADDTKRRQRVLRVLLQRASEQAGARTRRTMTGDEQGSTLGAQASPSRWLAMPRAWRAQSGRRNSLARGGCRTAMGRSSKRQAGTSL